MSRRTRGVVVGLVGLAISAAFVVRVLAQVDGDPTIFTSFGEDSAQITQYAEERLGRGVWTRDGLGHDGKYFFVLANDPLLTAPDENALIIDRPRYRAQRMLYPAVASVFGALPPQAIVWTLVVVNVLAMGLGSWIVAALATDMGLSAWWGLSFALNIGFISEQNIDGAGVLAAAAVFGAILLTRRGVMSSAIALFALGALTREAMLLAAGGTAFWLWRRERKSDAISVALIPAAVVGLWWFYVRMRLGIGRDVAEVQEIGLPFVGLARAAETWLSDPVDLLAGLAIVLLLLLFVRRVLNSEEVVGWAFIGFVPLAFVFTRQVWANYFDITRAIAPAITAFVLLVILSARVESRRETIRAGNR